MKTKAQKQKDLEALTEQFKNANAAMLVGFQEMTVRKTRSCAISCAKQAFAYDVVKNTLARRASEGTVLEAGGRSLQRCHCGGAEQQDPVGCQKQSQSLLRPILTFLRLRSESSKAK